MTTLIYPDPDVAPEGWTNIPVNVEHVRSLRKLEVIAANGMAGIQFFFTSAGTSIEWTFLTEADRDAAYAHILHTYGEPVG
jgi:hypothetical protein